MNWNHNKWNVILLTDFYRENFENSMSTGDDEGSGIFQPVLIKGTDMVVAL